MKDTDGHGTHVVGLIQKYAGKGNYCLIIVKYFDSSLNNAELSITSLKALNYVSQLGIPLVNISSAGMGASPYEEALIRTTPGTLYVGAAGNHGQSLKTFPCAYDLKNMVCVGSSTGEFSNYGKWVKFKEPGADVVSTLPNGKTGALTGTSMSTAIWTGKLINKYARN